MEIREFYKKEIYEAYFGKIREELEARFGARQQKAFALQKLLPKFVQSNGLKFTEIEGAIKQYSSFLEGDFLEIELEVQRWSIKWSESSIDGMDELPSLAKLIEEIDTFQIYFPNIMRLLSIFASTPVSTATAERSFSMLSRLYTTTRSTMGDDRLSNLAIGAHYWELTKNLDLDDLVNEFANKTRRIQLK